MGKKRTRSLQFDKQSQQNMLLRDGGCIFCLMEGYRGNDFERNILDCMHFVNKSQGGLGILQNGAIGCRYHHHKLDNGNQGLREDMLDYFEEYLKELYPDWSKDKLYYKKG